MVANPDYGWWETVRRVHPDVLGNFPEIATGLLSVEGIRWSELPGMRGVGRDGLLARAARDRPPRLRPRRHARRAAGALELARHLRPRGHAADAGLSPLHVRGLRRGVRGLPVDLRRFGRGAGAARQGAPHRTGRPRGDGPAAPGAGARVLRDQAPRRRGPHGLGGAAGPPARLPHRFRRRRRRRAAAPTPRRPRDSTRSSRPGCISCGSSSTRRPGARRVSPWCR